MVEQGDPDCQRLLKSLVSGYAKRDVLRGDVQKLLKIKGPESCP